MFRNTIPRLQFRRFRGGSGAPSTPDPPRGRALPDRRSSPTLAALALAALLVHAPSAAAQLREYRAVVTAEARTDTGLFDVHQVGERLLFEIPDSILG